MKILYKEKNMAAVITTHKPHRVVKMANDGINIKVKTSKKYNNLLRLVFSKISSEDFQWGLGLITLSKDEVYRTLKLSKSEINHHWYSFSNKMNEFATEVLEHLKIYNETTASNQILWIISSIEWVKNPEAVEKNNPICQLRVGEDAQLFFKDLGKDKPFLRYELSNYIALQTNQAGALFEYLERYYFMGKIQLTFDQLKEILDCQNYTNKNLTRRLKEEIEPQLKKTKDFKTLKREPIKNGKKILGYTYTWSYKERAEMIDNYRKIQQLKEKGIITPESEKKYRKEYNRGKADGEAIGYLDNLYKTPYQKGFQRGLKKAKEDTKEWVIKEVNNVQNNN